MKFRNKKSKIWLNFLSSILLCGILLSTVFGSAYARYEASVSKNVDFQYKNESGQIYIRSVESGETEAATTEFVLSNGTAAENYCSYDQKASISVFATIGLGNPDNFIITLVDGSTSYVASYTAVVKGTALYSNYGPGWIYHFYDANGEEITWEFPGNKFIERQMKIIVVGASEAPAALNLIVSAKPNEV